MSCASSSRTRPRVGWLSVLFGLLPAVINLPIVEKPVTRPIAATA